MQSKLHYINIFNKFFFYNYKYFVFLEKRCENHNNFCKFNIKNNVLLNSVFYFLTKPNYDIKNKQFLNKYINDLIFSYRGWRYFKKLPTNGQRTRAGFNNFTKNDQQLFDHKFKILLNQIRIDNKKLIASFLLVEYYNFLLYFQWFNEWLGIRIIRQKQKKQKLKKKKNSNTKIILLEEQNILAELVFIRNKLLKKKIKTQIKNVNLVLGLKPGTFMNYKKKQL